MFYFILEHQQKTKSHADHCPQTQDDDGVIYGFRTSIYMFLREQTRQTVGNSNQFEEIISYSKLRLVYIRIVRNPLAQVLERFLCIENWHIGISNVFCVVV